MKYSLWASLTALVINTAAAQDIEEIIVSASPIHKNHSDNASPISVLNGAQLRTKAASTLAETLSGQAGISTSSFGPNVGNPVIRGQSGPRVKILQDNLDTLDASTTSADHANTTEPLLAEQIEILRGPATLRFGSGAIGGVVNVIDSRIPTQLTDEALSGIVEVRHSSVNDETASVLRLDGTAGRIGWHLDGLYRDSNDTEIPGAANKDHPEESSHGFVENSHAQAEAYTVGASWFGETGFLGISINKQDNQYGIPPGAHEHHSDDDDDHDEELVRIDMQQTRIDIKGELDDPLSGFNKLRLRLAHNDYEHQEIEGHEVGTTYQNDAYEGRVELLHNPIANWQGAVGAQFTHREFNVIGEEAFLPKADILSTGLFIIEEQHWDSPQPHWVEWGLRIERQSVKPQGQKDIDHTVGSGSIAYHWSPLSDHHFSASASIATRAPTLEELTSNGPHIASQSYDIGNEDLDPERSHNLDIGYEWRPSLHNTAIESVSINLFNNHMNDYIYARNTGIEHPTEELDIYRYTQEDANFYGLEAEFTVRINDTLNARLFGDYVRAKLDQGGDIPRTTPARAGVEFQYANDAINASLQWITAGSQNNPGENEEKTDGYDQLDAELTWSLNNATPVEVFIRGRNLLDEEIRHATSILRDTVPSAGRNITTGIRVEF